MVLPKEVALFSSRSIPLNRLKIIFGHALPLLVLYWFSVNVSFGVEA
jgi:hypothetical protein